MSVNLRTVYAFAREMYPKNVTADIQYGTAGFRTRYEKLEYVMYRMGLLATLRSRARNGLTIGVMITASHNPEPDNGVKLIDPMGEMLEPSWERIATELANVSDQELQAQIAKIIAEQHIDIGSASCVFVGMDNRYHSPGLLKAVSDGVLALKGKVKSYGIVTTPMMHYHVVCANTNGAYGVPTEEGYYKKLTSAFVALRGTGTGAELERGNYRNRLVFDGANGVGGRKMLQFMKYMHNTLGIEVFNKGEGKINHECGADHVKVQQCAPVGLPADLAPNTRCVSVDGDADRVVYFFVDENNQFNLLDGDRIGTLIAGYLMGLLRQCSGAAEDDGKLTIGIVQTAYANGASTDYIRNKLKVTVACTSTGVKHLHHKAIEYDIGIYFEANGHGTVVFSDKARKSIHTASKNVDNTLNDKQVWAAKKLLLTIDMINETVGDAISDMLLVETILLENGWDVQDWLRAYDDLPNCLRKVTVADRQRVTTADAERVCVTPEGLQAAIEQVVTRYPRGRSFVRSSGTEDVVRVYAEASTKEHANHLAAEVELLVYKMAGGVGPEPALPNGLIASHI